MGKATRRGKKAGSVAAISGLTKTRRRATKRKAEPKAPRQSLKRKDVQLICDELKDIDVEELRSDVARQVESGYHMHFFEERLNLWKHIKSTNVMALDSLISAVLEDFVKIYREHSKGKNKYTRLLLGWYAYMNQYVLQGSDVGEATWRRLVERYRVPAGGVSECTRSCLVSSLMMGIFHEMLRRVECFVSELPGTTPSSFFPSATDYRADDEASLYRLAGFALFSCIQLRQRKLVWRKKLQVNQEAAQKLRTELALLNQLKDAKKSDLPAAIHIQDRGHMTFMNPTLLPFIRNVAAEVRKLLNFQEYSKHGKEFFKYLRQQLPMASLSSNFRQHAQPLLVGVPSDEVMISLCEQLVLKISHTMSNDFLRNISTLENIKEKKAVDAQMSLRDELKTFASHTKSSFSTN